jgi:uncharacterized membrane protein YecN with MAPEG domain
MHAPMTLLYGGLTLLWVVLLGMNVTRARVRLNAGLGTAPAEMTREVRAHGNAAEWAPLAVVLLLLLELSGLSSTALHVLGGTVLAGRVMHGVGALSPPARALVSVGAVVNYLVMLVMACWAVVQHFR